MFQGLIKNLGILWGFLTKRNVERGLDRASSPGNYVHSLPTFIFIFLVAIDLIGSLLFPRTPYKLSKTNGWSLEVS